MRQEERNVVRECRRSGNALRMAGVFTLGAAMGSVMALLYAPASGRVTRRRIGMKMHALQRSSARRIGQAGRVLSRNAEHLRDATTERLSEARSWVVNHFANGQARHAVRRPRRRALRHA